MKADTGNINYLKSGKGALSWLLTRDHKRVGLMYLALLCLAFMVGGYSAIALRGGIFAGGGGAIDLVQYDFDALSNTFTSLPLCYIIPAA